MLRILKSTRDSYLRQQGLNQYIKRRGSHSLENVKHKSIIDEKHLAQYGLDKFQTGKLVQGFLVNEVARINEMHLFAIRLTHSSTGAQYLHVARDDSNNVFCVAFRTTPMDSTGLPHILEHTTLCGSARYPCKDPFFKMLRRSLATFMNAMTTPDYTMYPFSTQNLKDYRNLQSVYLDSVFSPNLRELDFKQEGWRLEHENVNDKGTPIVFKGIVFNEMKGAYNDNESILTTQFLKYMLPSHTYAHNFGGDPRVIPTLRHADLVNFHSTYYHPSNSRFYSYGNFPLEGHLKYINEEYLISSDKIDPTISEVPTEKRWDKPKKEHIVCRRDPLAADQSRQGHIAIGYLCDDVLDTQRSFEMHILSDLLLRGESAPLYKAIVESDVATSISSLSGYSTHCRDTMFVAGFVGIRPNDFKKADELVQKSLQNLVETGVEKDQVEAILHRIELSVKHQSSNFGLSLLFNLMPLWNHNGDLVESLKINQAVERFREKLREDPKYLEHLIEKYLLNNSHKLVLTMLPDEKYDQNLLEAERVLLESKLKNLSKDELDQIYVDGQTLRADQETDEDTNVLPTLKIEDLKEDMDRYKLTDIKVADVPLQVAIEPTNGVSYYRGIVNIKDLSNELKNLIPLFNSVVAKMGTQNYDYGKFDQMIRLKTDSLSFRTHISPHKSNVLQYEEGVMIESFCLDRNVNDMFKLWLEVFNNVNLTDPRRFQTLVKTLAADAINGISDQGMDYAINTAASLVSPLFKLRNELLGFPCIERLKKIVQTEDVSPTLHKMREIASHILNKQHLRSAINMSKENQDDNLETLTLFHNSLKGTCGDSYILTNATDFYEKNSAVHYVLPYSVNYLAKAILTVPIAHPEHAPLKILAQLISSTYLHPEIREKGGAYHGGARMLSDGLFVFCSYRDPNSTRTLDLFDRAYDFLHQYSLKQSDIDEAKLRVFQALDAPIAPSRRGMNKFMHNIMDDDVQRLREQLKAVTKDQIMHVAKTYLQSGHDLKVGRSLIGPVNPDVINRGSENWIVQNQEEEQARVAK